jgi:hypothetical protein
MDKDLKKLIIETINKTFAEAQEKLVQRGIREIQYDICPHCKTEIHEKHEYSEDGGASWHHSDCGGLIARKETPLEEVVDWLRPYVKEAQEQRRQARKELGFADLPSEEPGGTMSAVNTSGLATESGALPQNQIKESEVTQKEETLTVAPRTDAKFVDRSVILLNACQIPLKVSITEFTAMTDDVHSVKKYFVRIDNG